MKTTASFASRGLLTLAGSLLGFALLTGGKAQAQNFVRNPDFDSPLGPDNWTIVYPNNSSEADFFIHGRSTLAHHDKVYQGAWEGNYFGLHFRPYTDGLIEVYASQIITNLTPFANYVISAWMVQFESSFVSKNNVWLEALGGPNGAISKVTPYVVNYSYQNDGWAKYSVNNSASSTGSMEVRLRFKKISYTSGHKWLNIDAFYDHVSVMPAVATPLPQPRILALTLTNQTASFNWTTIINNTYDIEMSPDLSAWSKFKTNLLATGTNLTLTTSYVVDPANPRFFRIQQFNYVP